MQSEAPLSLILSPLRAMRGQLERTQLWSLFGDPDTVPPKVPSPFVEGRGSGSSRLHGYGLARSNLDSDSIPGETLSDRRSPAEGQSTKIRHISVTISYPISLRSIQKATKPQNARWHTSCGSRRNEKSARASRFSREAPS